MRAATLDDHRPRPVSVAGLVGRFGLAGLVVMLLLGTALALLARQAGTQQAVDSARQVSWVTTRGIVEPRLTAAVLAGDATALAGFDAAMHRYVLRGSLVRVKVWDIAGRIVYSDDPRLVGRTFGLEEDEREAMETSGIDSGISDLSRPENTYERPFGKLLEVYVGMTAAGGEHLLFESYFRYDAVVTAAQAQWEKYAPPTLAALLGLQLVQIPFAWSLARRLQRQQLERQRLLQHAVDASTLERRRIAADLHDGVVQELTGLTYTLDASRIGHDQPERQRQVVTETASALRGSIAQLRSLLIDLYPPSLSEDGLPAALAELANGLEREGLQVDLDVQRVGPLPLEVSAVLFRGAQEVLRNVAAHSAAQQVSVDVGSDGRIATLVVDDDGSGFDQQQMDDRFAQGHIGLRSLGDLVADAGGTMVVRSAPGQGTRTEIRVPL